MYKKAPTSSSVDDGDGPTLLPSHRKPKAEGVSFTEFTYSEPSIGGTAKAIGAWKVESEVSSSRNEHLSAVIIAIRGSAKVVDHMVNLNGRPVPVNDFLVSFILLIFELRSDIFSSTQRILSLAMLIFQLMPDS